MVDDEYDDDEELPTSAVPELCPEDPRLVALRRELLKKYQPIEGSSFLSTYVELGERASNGNELMHVLMAMVLSGQALHRVRIGIGAQQQDARIHGMIFQKSGTGKGPAFVFARDVATAAGMSMTADTSCTTAGLIGTVGKDGEPSYGPAYYFDVTGFQEASTLFITSEQQHSADLINIINQITDVGGNVSKRLGTGWLRYRSHCSLIGTTYPPEARSKYITTGMLPRMVMAYKPVSRDFYWNIWSWLGANLNAPVLPNQGEGFERVAATLAAMREKANAGWSFTFRNVKGHEQTRKDVCNVLDEFDETVGNSAEPFISRIAMYNIKLAMLSAAWSFRSEVIDEDWNVARNMIVPIWGSILKFISHYDVTVVNREQQGMYDWMMRKMKDDGYVTQHDLFHRFRSVSLEKRRCYISDLLEQGAIVREATPSYHGGRPSVRYLLPPPKTKLEEMVTSQPASHHKSVALDELLHGI